MVTRTDLVAEYLCNGSAKDTSGFGHDGVVHGAIPTSDRFGHPAGALLFDGNDDYIVVDPPPRLSDRALTVSAWARYDADAFGVHRWSNCIVCQDDGRDDDQSRRIFQISTFGNRIIWHRFMDVHDPQSQGPIVPHIWYHVAAVFADGVHTLYVQGVPNDSRAHGQRTHDGQPIHIGRKGTPERYFFFNGAIDDVRIYNRALTAAEIQSLYEENGYRPSKGERR